MIPHKNSPYQELKKQTKPNTDTIATCNILLTSDAEIVTLRNHGMAGNCTLATAFPASIKIIQLSVGVEDRSSRTPHRDFEMGILTRSKLIYEFNNCNY
ncbi:hypothetical protein Anas_01464 [Armadillidium nasatum]|uniref:Uncharacterized protein n=1 Tax=Armadillidium nasatum TaxID=96803 RepID=A0A5N5SYB0_9CRUS|nr:hypothetical protein Anas_01464 [Armadillidium nasatum]